jgi:hypothetical protein
VSVSPYISRLQMVQHEHDLRLALTLQNGRYYAIESMKPLCIIDPIEHGRTQNLVVGAANIVHAQTPQYRRVPDVTEEGGTGWW